VIDPLGGSYYVEALTTRIEQEVFAILAKVDAMGGTIAAIEAGWFQHEIADSAYEFARRKASGEAPVIGVNTYAEPPEPIEIPIHRIDASVETRQVGRLKAVRAERDRAQVDRLLDRLAEAAAHPTANLMGPTIEAVKARATLGEIVTRLRKVWGSYVERPVF
jgi:methylmalonyl-CoA mutase cobalamin-binding domain/chain